MIDNLFTGNVLGHESDIADGRLRGYEFRSLNNIVGDYYVAPKFLEAVAVSVSPYSLPLCLNLFSSLKSTTAARLTHSEALSEQQTASCDSVSLTPCLGGVEQRTDRVHVQMHIVKNWLVDNGWLDHTIRVPLILGIWGGKGQGVL